MKAEKLEGECEPIVGCSGSFMKELGLSAMKFEIDRQSQLQTTIWFDARESFVMSFRALHERVFNDDLQCGPIYMTKPNLSFL